MVHTEAATGEARGGADLLVHLIFSDLICLFRVLLLDGHRRAAASAGAAETIDIWQETTTEYIGAGTSYQWSRASSDKQLRNKIGPDFG